MTITIQYLAQLKRLVGRAEEQVDCPADRTLAELLTSLGHRCLLDEDGRPSRGYLYFIDDGPAAFDQILSDGAVVTILAPMAGGTASPSRGHDPRVSLRSTPG